MDLISAFQQTLGNIGNPDAGAGGGFHQTDRQGPRLTPRCLTCQVKSLRPVEFT